MSEATPPPSLGCPKVTPRVGGAALGIPSEGGDGTWSAKAREEMHSVYAWRHRCLLRKVLGRALPPLPPAGPSPLLPWFLWGGGVVEGKGAPSSWSPWRSRGCPSFSFWPLRAKEPDVRRKHASLGRDGGCARPRGWFSRAFLGPPSSRDFFFPSHRPPSVPTWTPGCAFMPRRCPSQFFGRWWSLWHLPCFETILFACSSLDFIHLGTALWKSRSLPEHVGKGVLALGLGKQAA